MLHDDSHEAVPQVIQCEDGPDATLGRNHEIASEFDDIRQVGIDEMLREVELVRAGQDGLSLFVEHGIGTEKEAIASDDFFFVGIPDNQLFIGILHLVVFVQVYCVAG